MIDVHCHLLPGIDDGAKTLDVSLAMAKMAAEDGIEVVACTPHIMPGVYDNRPADIRQKVAELQNHLRDAGIAITLVAGCDAHMRPDFVEALRTDQVQPIAGGRYVLFEPPHHVAPPMMSDCVFNIQAAGWVPILTHPERLTWIEDKYDLVTEFARSGVLIQITAGSVLGSFGPRPKYWADRMLGEGLVHILASDGHNASRRPPVMAKARDVVSSMLGAEEADNMVRVRPGIVVANRLPSEMPPLPERAREVKGGGVLGSLKRLFLNQSTDKKRRA